ncbi:MAG: hypothetical protein HND55_04275 [Pseudomonadota bacterium]|nr:MAG: hypothetical protein HND55_04275 [Pseudomonadota bacterium]
MPNLLRKSKVKRAVGALVLEFLIVFLGVYLAYVFSDMQELRRERHIQIKYCRTLIHEFKVLDALLAAQQQQLEQGFLPVIAAIDAGQKPALHIEPIFFDFRGLTLESAFMAENFDALDESILANLAGGHSSILGIQHRVTALRAHLRTLQQSSEGSTYLYHPDGRLRETFHWYVSLPQEISDFTRRLRGALTVATEDLEQRIETLNEQWP